MNGKGWLVTALAGGLLMMAAVMVARRNASPAPWRRMVRMGRWAVRMAPVWRMVPIASGMRPLLSARLMGRAGRQLARLWR
ncbi:hypothetical protein JCM14720_02620 [Calditerricola yamamurae]